MISRKDLLRVSVRQVIRQKSYGVIFSIALGITAFIALAVLGREIRYNIGQDMVLMGGVNIIQVIMNDGAKVGQPSREFYPEVIEELRKVPGTSKVSAALWGTKDITIQKEDQSIFIMFHGVDQYYWDTYSANLVAGRLLNEADVNNHSRVCVLGWELAEKLYGSSKNALGKTLNIDNDLFKVVGIVGGIMIGTKIREAFIPETTMRDRGWAGGKINRLHIRAIAWEDVDTIVKKIPAIVNTYQDAPNLLIRTQDEQLSRIQNTFTFVEALLWLGIAASLMLGGFGIWYGTFAAVRARTREVGLKKAMGGSDKDILSQFLAEALCKSVAGGFLGILLGTACVELGSYALGSNISYPLLALSGLGSIVFSAVIGVGGGLYPALQASRMDVVTALRFE